MSAGLSGVRADRKHSYRSLERMGEGIRTSLDYNSRQAINPLDEHLYKVSIKMNDGRLTSLSFCKADCDVDEGQIRTLEKTPRVRHPTALGICTNKVSQVYFDGMVIATGGLRLACT